MFNKVLIGLISFITFTNAYAFNGGFVDLPESGTLRVYGSSYQEEDPFLIDHGSIISEDEYGVRTYNFPSNFVLLDQRTTSFTAPENENIVLGKFFDYVFKDVTDNTLVFGSRLSLNTDVEEGYFEINDIFRNGFSGYSTAVAWTYYTDNDKELYSTAKTSNGFGQSDTYNPNTVSFRSDINVEEGNPDTGLYFIKTNATEYALANDAVRLRQGGEEGGGIINISFSGYSAVSPVPEPSTYGMILIGFVLVGFILRGNKPRNNILSY